jgi:hypothetical protein
VTYDLRRLRMHGLIERIPDTHRYRLTSTGLRTALFCSRLYNRALRPGFAAIDPKPLRPELPIAKTIRAAETALDQWYRDVKLAA